MYAEGTWVLEFFFLHLFKIPFTRRESTLSCSLDDAGLKYEPSAPRPPRGGARPGLGTGQLHLKQRVRCSPLECNIARHHNVAHTTGKIFCDDIVDMSHADTMASQPLPPTASYRLIGVCTFFGLASLSWG